MPPISSRRALWSAIAVCVAFFAGVFLIVSLSPHPLDHGDTHTDLRAIIAAHEFNRIGTSELHYMQTTDGGPEIGLRPMYYSRHPAVGSVILAYLQRAGMSLGAARFAPLLASTIGVFCVFMFFRTATRNDWFGVLAAAVYATLSPVWLLADSYLLYSWSLAGKAGALWMIAAGCEAAGGGRWWRFGVAGLIAAACIVLGGLETMPSTGFLAFLLPLVLVRDRGRKRLGVALLCTALVGAGMVLGLFLRIWNMAQAEGSFEQAFANFSGSLRHRSSLSGISDETLQLPYPVEILRRTWIYTPHVFWLLALALVATYVVRLATGRWPKWTGVGLMVALLVGEGLYFVGMRNHATEHFHTLILLTMTMTAIASSSLALFVSLVPARARWVPAIAVVAVLLIVARVAPLEGCDYGNLQVPKIPDDWKTFFFDETDAEARLLPPNSLVLVATPTWQWTVYGARLALQGHSMIICNPGEQRPFADVYEHARGSGRPVFAMVFRGGTPEDAVAEIAAKGRPVSSGVMTSLYALANYDPAKLPTSKGALPDAVLKETQFTSPTAEQLAAAGIKFPFFGKTTFGVWLSVPGEGMGAPATVGLVPFVADPGFSRIHAAIATFGYDRREGFGQQPPVVVGFRVRAKSGAESRGAMSVEQTITPGGSVDCRIPVPDGVEVMGFEIWARRPDGEKSASGASVSCSQIQFEY